MERMATAAAVCLAAAQFGGCGAPADNGGASITSKSAALVCPTKAPRTQDYDGDGKADLVVFRPSEGNWYVKYSSTGLNQPPIQFGVSTDKLVPGDYDGDCKTDVAVFRPSEGNWYVKYSSTGVSQPPVQFGMSTDKLVPADYDGDGKTDIAVYRPSVGTWYVHPSTGVGDMVTQFGVSTDKLAPADYDGDGKADPCVLRDTNQSGSWFVRPSTQVPDIVVTNPLSVALMRPVPGNYDNTHAGADIVYGANSAPDLFWVIRADPAPYPYTPDGGIFGVPTDRMVPADYDGDGRTDRAVFRPSNGTWYVRPIAGGPDIPTQFGTASDVIPYSQ